MRKPLGARMTSFAFVNLGKKKKIKKENEIERFDDQRSSLLRKKKKEAGWKRAAVIFYVFTPMGREKRREIRNFGVENWRRKKNMARVSNNRHCGNFTSMPLLKFGKLPSSNVSSSSIVSSSLRINKKKQSRYSLLKYRPRHEIQGKNNRKKIRLLID